MSRIAIIGSGISGMGAAYLLNHSGHDITMYEKNPTIGGHTRTKFIDYDGKRLAVDTGFIVFNHLNYPNLCGMFNHLRVPTEKSDMTFSATVNGGEIEWGAANLNAVFGQRENLLRPEFYGFIRDILRFNHFALKTARKHPELTLGQLLDRLKAGEWYRKYFILPIGGAIWSCSLEQMLEFPALYFTQFFKDHRLLSVIGQPQWYTVTGGSYEYMRRLTFPYQDKIRTDCGVTSISRGTDYVDVTDTQGKTERYDQIVMACHGDQALAMLEDASDEETEVLRPFKYSINNAYLHKDTSIMPTRKRCWASWVYHADDTKPKQSVIPITYWMNRLQNIEQSRPIFVSLNPLTEIAEEHIFDHHIFEHPIYTPESVAAQKKLPLIQGKQRTWFCGAHWHSGFHEDGLKSAVNVATALGAHIPW